MRTQRKAANLGSLAPSGSLALPQPPDASLCVGPARRDLSSGPLVDCVQIHWQAACGYDRTEPASKKGTPQKRCTRFSWQPCVCENRKWLTNSPVASKTQGCQG